MDQDQKNSFLKTQSQLASLGPSVQSLASEIVTGGVRTKEGIATMTALGPAGEELQRAVKQQQGLSKDASEEEKRRAKEAVDMATAKVNERIASKEYAQIANTATGETASQMLKIASENKGVQTQLAAVQEAGGDLAKATKAQREEAQLRIGGYKVDDQGKGVASGQKDEFGKDILLKEEGNRLSRTINDANARGIIQAEGLARNFKLANDEIGKSPDAIKLFNTLLRGAGTATTGEQAQKDQKPIFDKANTRQDASKQTPAGYDTNKPMPVVNKAPEKAEGGVVPGTDTGTTVTVGEKGAPEAIVPLDKLNNMMQSKEGGGINIAEISKTISTTLSSAQSPNEGKGADKGALESTLSDFQKTVLKYAYTEGEMKQGQLENEQNIIRGKQAAILENVNRIAEIEKAADGRELTRREQSRIEKLQVDIQSQVESIAKHQEALEVYENLDALTNQNVTESKKAATEETIVSLKEQEAAGYAANRAAAAARDALEEKAELENRAMTEAEEAQYKLLGIELNASSDKITAAQEAQKEFEESQRVEAAAAKLAAFEKINAAEVAAFVEKQSIQVGLADTVKAAQEEVKAKVETSKEVVASFVKSTNIPKPEEMKSQMEGMFSKMGGAGGMLGDMFNPKIIDTKLAEANKAKLSEVKKEAPPAPKPAAAPAPKPAEAKVADKEIGIKDLNEQLKMLNMNMLKLISHSETISGASEKTAKNSAKATGNRYA
jgi:hypothetical protein